MRERLSRGKKKDGTWIIGYYVHLHDSKGHESHRIYSGYAETDCGDYYPDWEEVDPKTVGELTGLPDSKGKRIFEGDIIRIGSRVRFVFYGAGTFRHTRHGEYASDLTIKDANNCEVIGTIHDNPELLEVTEND